MQRHFTIVVPCYEREHELARLLRSLSRQPRIAEGEIIVSDDASPRPLAEAFATFEMPCPLRFVRGPNAGPGIARQRGAEAARGDWLLFIDSDCEAADTWLGAALAALEEGGGCVFGPVRSELPPKPPFLHGWNTDASLFPAASFAIGRADFHRCGGFTKTSSYVAEDWEFRRQLDETGVAVRYVEPMLARHPLAIADTPTIAEHFKRSARSAREMRGFVQRHRERWRDEAVINRTLLRRALPRLGLALALAPMPFVTPALGVALGLRHRARANALLARSNVPLRVPLANALRFGLAWPLVDGIRYFHRVRHGIGGIDPTRIPTR